MNKEWRPPDWAENSLLELTSDVIACYEAGADAIIQALHKESRGRIIRFGKADDGHILIYVED